MSIVRHSKFNVPNIRHDTLYAALNMSHAVVVAHNIAKLKDIERSGQPVGHCEGAKSATSEEIRCGTACHPTSAAESSAASFLSFLT